MPQATDLTLKNAAAVNKTFALATPASATAPAVWFLREGANQSIFPKVEISSDRIAKGDGRKVKATVRVPTPVVDSNGVTRSSGEFLFVIDGTVPALVPDSIRDDAIAYVGSLITAALVKEIFKTGYSAT